ncbi:MAG: cell surface protein SprA, partial [Chitinophagaceae bacterium]
MDITSAHIFRTLVAFTTILLAFTGQSNARFYQAPQTNQPDTSRTDTLRYPIRDRHGDPYTNPNRNAFDLRDTAFVKQNVEYDPLTGQYYIIEKIGGTNYRTPVTFTRDEFLRLQGKKDENAYFRKRADMLSEMNRRIFKPKFNTSKSWFNRIVGVGKIDIKPSGYVDLLAGYQGQNIKNPTLPERARKNGGLDFNMNAQLQVDANIGDKLKLPINYNTLANFEFENQLNLNYQGKDDEIIKQFQLGNVNFTSKGTLIPGAQSLFGIKTQLQFGK